MKRNKGWAPLSVSAATSHSFFRSRFTLPFLGLPAVTLVCPLFYSVCKGSQLRLSFFFCFVFLSWFVWLSFSCIFFPVFFSCGDAQLLWNVLIPLAYVQDIVSVPFKSNGFRTGKALISAAHCCLCVDARCWPHSLSGLRETVFSFETFSPSQLPCCTCVRDRDGQTNKKGVT